MSHGVTTVSNDAAAERRSMRVREQVDEPGARGCRRRQACAARAAVAARREREFVELERVAARDALGDDQQQRIEVERHGERGRRPHVQVVCESTGAGAEHQYFAWRLIAQQRGEQLERGLVLRIAPAPVAMDVGVVSREPLIRWQARAQREVRFVARRVLLDFERCEQRPQSCAVVARRALEALEPCPRGGAQRRARERGGELLSFALEPLQRKVQAAAPFAEGGIRLGE